MQVADVNGEETADLQQEDGDEERVTRLVHAGGTETDGRTEGRPGRRTDPDLLRAAELQLLQSVIISSLCSAPCVCVLVGIIGCFGPKEPAASLWDSSTCWRTPAHTARGGHDAISLHPTCTGMILLASRRQPGPN